MLEVGSCRAWIKNRGLCVMKSAGKHSPATLISRFVSGFEVASGVIEKSRIFMGEDLLIPKTRGLIQGEVRMTLR